MKKQSSLERYSKSGVMARPRYFPGQLITDEELTLDQYYFKDKHRRHAIYMHGWGVVCAVNVCKVVTNNNVPEPWKVKVSPGYVLGPCGNEIHICKEQILDLRTISVTQPVSEGSEYVPDPWCSEVMQAPTEAPVFLAVRYDEVSARPVRVQPFGCGCEETQCEYSRLQDGYAFGLLAECPEGHTEPDVYDGSFYECPPRPFDPWVVLAKIDFDTNDGNITDIDIDSCRRIVSPQGTRALKRYIGTWLVRGPLRYDANTSAKTIINKIPEDVAMGLLPAHGDEDPHYTDNDEQEPPEPSEHKWRHRSFIGIDWNNIRDVEDNIHQHLPGDFSEDPFAPESDSNFAGKHHVLAFFLIYIKSPEERTTRLCVRTDDAIRVWLNTEEIVELKWDDDRDINDFGTEICQPITLNPGRNVLLAAIAETQVEWGFSARIENDIGLRFTTVDPGS